MSEVKAKECNKSPNLIQISVDRYKLILNEHFKEFEKQIREQMNDPRNSVCEELKNSLKKAQVVNGDLRERTAKLEECANLEEQWERENNMVVTRVTKQGGEAKDTVVRILKFMKFECIIQDIKECRFLTGRNEGPILMKLFGKIRLIHTQKLRQLKV